MNTLYENYLNHNIPVKERYFYLITFFCSVTSLIVSCFGLVFRLHAATNLIFFSVCIVGVSMFFLERKFHKTRLLSHIFLFICNIVIFPIALYAECASSVEIPIYGLIGITFSLVLMEGRERILHFVTHIFVVISSFFWFFIYRSDKVISFNALTKKEYIRLDFAILMSGILCGGLIYYRNIVIRNELKEQLKADEAAEELGFSKDMFLVNVSHEIRTPLNAIIGITDILLDSDANNHVLEMAYNISNSSHALLSITSDLLDFSRISSDEIKVNNEKYDISIMLNDIINLISARLLDSNLILNVYVNPKIPKRLIGDSGKIRQVIINLLSNAIKYTNYGHVDISVDMENKEDGAIDLIISVSDTGIGIETNNIDKIFEPYNRSGSERDLIYEGNGLGLALCKRLANSLEGDLLVESEYEKGSKFTFIVPEHYEVPYYGAYVGEIKKDVKIVYFANKNKEIHDIGNTLDKMSVVNREVFSDNEFLDICREDCFDFYMLESISYERLKEKINSIGIDWKKIVVISGYNYSYAGEPFEYVLTKPVSCLNIADLINETKNYTIRKQAYKGKFTLENTNILVVDDNIINLDVTSELLSRYNCSVVKAASGKECLTCLQHENFDLVLLDYMMPEMDGIDTLKAIREMKEEYSKLPVICFSANVVSGARNMFMSEGFDEYLAKPLEIDQLEKVLLEFIPGEKLKLIL